MHFIGVVFATDVWQRTQMNKQLHKYQGAHQMIYVPVTNQRDKDVERFVVMGDKAILLASDTTQLQTYQHLAV